ncbi:MAG: DegV family protein [Oscillospiraceae bacterium]|nr:DegV family protein [Oscillospiraceae bacterium]
MYHIFTDTSANLPVDLLKKHGIAVVALRYSVDGAESSAFCSSTGEFDGHTFYEKLRGGAEVKTTMANLSDFTEVFRPVLMRGEDVLHIGLSGGISGTSRGAELAAAELRTEFPNRTVQVIDTKAASLGEGLSVLLAAELREEGHSLEEVARQVVTYTEKVCQYFTVPDLHYLQKGGRVSRLTARIGSMLNIKPILQSNEAGEIVLHGKVRGQRRALEALARVYNELCRDRSGRIGIAHADAPEDADALLGQLRTLGFTGDCVNVCYEPVTGAHVGPGAVALFFPGIHR